MRIPRIAASALVAVAVGCSNYDRYEIRLTPVPEGMRRELTCWRAPPSEKHPDQVREFPAERLARIAAAYGEAPPAERRKKHVFQRVFQSEMPQDVEGSGSFARHASPFGTLFVYSERFRGEDDLQSALERRTAAADRIANLLLAWAERESAGREGYEPLRALLDGPLRRDLKNLAWTVVLSNPGGDLKASWALGHSAELSARLSQYLFERGYAPSVVAVREEMPRAALRMAVRRAGFSEDTPPAAFAFLAPDRIDASWNAFADGSPLVAKLVRGRGPMQRYSAVHDEFRPAPRDPRDLLKDLFHFDLFGRDFDRHPDHLALVLECGTEPFSTNGTWDPQRNAVVWGDAAIAESGTLPTLRFASWVVPTADAQAPRFGRVILEHGALGDYATWYAALRPAQRAAWDAQIALLVPGPFLKTSVANLALIDGAGQDLAEPARTLLKHALEEPPASAKPTDR